MRKIQLAINLHAAGVDIGAAERMTKAMEETTELAAEAGANMLKSMEQSTAVAETKPATRRRTAVKKAD